MNPNSPSNRKSNIKESLKILRAIDETLNAIQEALLEDGHHDDQIVFQNIQREKALIINRTIETLKNYEISCQTLGDAISLLEDAKNKTTLIPGIDPYLAMRLEAFAAMAKGVLAYAQKNETSKGIGREEIMMFLPKATNVMEIRGTLREYFNSKQGQRVRIRIPGEHPKTLFTANNSFIDEAKQREVLYGKNLTQPRVMFEANGGDHILNPEVILSTEEELETFIQGGILDELIRHQFPGRITIDVM